MAWAENRNVHRTSLTELIRSENKEATKGEQQETPMNEPHFLRDLAADALGLTSIAVMFVAALVLPSIL